MAEALTNLRVLVCGAMSDGEVLVRGALPGARVVAARGEDAVKNALLLSGPWSAVVACEGDDPKPAWVFDTVQAMRLDVATVALGEAGGEEAAVRAVKDGAGGFVSRSTVGRLPEVLALELADVGSREQRREEVRRARATEAFLRAVMDNVADAIVIWADDGRVVTMNRAAEAFFGRRAEKDGRLDGARLLGGAPPLRDGGRGLTGRELSGKRPDGSPFVGEATYGAMYEGSRRYEIVAVRDVTARRRLERSLAAAQRFESLGALAGELAHDLNTMLSSVLAYAELIAGEAPTEGAGGDEGRADDGRAEDLAGLRAAARSASGLLQQLLAFARRQQLSPTRVEPRVLVEAALRTVRPLLGASVRAAVRVDDDAPAVRADAGQLERALVNLCVNARDAMPSGGELEVRARRALVEPPGAARWPGAPPGLYAEIEVRDSGTGVDARVAERIFEPFVTSKPGGQGTGLGLAVVRGVVEQHGGMVECEPNEPGPGTTFRFLVPADAAEREALEQGSSGEKGAGEKGRLARPLVMVAVAQPSVRRLLARELTRAGYAARAAGDCEEVRRALSEGGDARGAALLVLDESLPGDEPARAMLAGLDAKRLPVLLLRDEAAADEAPGTRESTGAGPQGDELGAGRLAPVVSVARHFAYADLEAQVRALLDRRGGAP